MSQTLPLIALGGAAGAVLPYRIVTAIGARFVLVLRADWQLFLMTGLLGGLVTFSAFSLDIFRLFEQGQPLQTALCALGSVALSLVAVALGVAIARSLT